MPANQSTPEVTRALKPCPFCGSEHPQWVGSADGDYVECGSCLATMPPHDPDVPDEVQRWNTRTPARGGDELREALENHTRWLDEISTNSDMAEIVADGGVTAGMVVQQEAREQRRRLLRALASTDMAGASVPDRLARRMGAEFVARDAAPPVEGLTSGEGWQLVPVKPTQEMVNAGVLPLNRTHSVRDVYAAMLVASPKATATASVREGKLGWDEDCMCDDHYRQGCPECALTDSGTAATIGGERA